MTKTLIGVFQRLCTETFTGSGNRREDARENAFIRYQTWKLVQRKAGRIIHEKSTEYSYRQRNEVHCRCTLAVEYVFL